MTLVNDRSKCVHCETEILWYDLVPIFSFMILRGRCRSCDESIPKHYFAVEIAMALLFLWTAWSWSHHLYSDLMISSIIELVRNFFIVTVMVFLFVYDLKYYLLPDEVTLPAIAIIFIIQVYLGMSIKLLLLGMVVGFTFFFLQYALSKGKWVGGGDMRFGALMGAILSWPLVVVGLFLAYIIGAIVALIMMALGKKSFQSQLPFGTFLAIATLITLWWGTQLLQWYVHLL